MVWIHLDTPLTSNAVNFLYLFLFFFFLPPAKKETQQTMFKKKKKKTRKKPTNFKTKKQPAECFRLSHKWYAAQRMKYFKYSKKKNQTWTLNSIIRWWVLCVWERDKCCRERTRDSRVGGIRCEWRVVFDWPFVPTCLASIYIRAVACIFVLCIRVQNAMRVLRSRGLDKRRPVASSQVALLTCCWIYETDYTQSLFRTYISLSF